MSLLANAGQKVCDILKNSKDKYFVIKIYFQSFSIEICNFVQNTAANIVNIFFPLFETKLWLQSHFSKLF